MKKCVLLWTIMTSVLFGSCKYNKEEELYPPAPTCNTGPVTFSTTINGVFTTYDCTFCHGSVAPSGNISLTNYNSVRSVALNGKLLGSITHASGFSPMPQGGAKIPPCEIAKVKAWIDAGAPNN